MQDNWSSCSCSYIYKATANGFMVIQSRQFTWTCKALFPRVHCLIRFLTRASEALILIVLFLHWRVFFWLINRPLTLSTYHNSKKYALTSIIRTRATSTFLLLKTTILKFYSERMLFGSMPNVISKNDLFAVLTQFKTYWAVLWRARWIKNFIVIKLNNNQLISLY